MALSCLSFPFALLYSPPLCYYCSNIFENVVPFIAIVSTSKCAVSSQDKDLVLRSVHEGRHQSFDDHQQRVPCRLNTSTCSVHLAFLSCPDSDCMLTLSVICHWHSQYKALLIDCSRQITIVCNRSAQTGAGHYSAPVVVVTCWVGLHPVASASTLHIYFSGYQF
jgi:hypothetical protein